VAIQAGSLVETLVTDLTEVSMLKRKKTEHFDYFDSERLPLDQN